VGFLPASLRQKREINRRGRRGSQRKDKEETEINRMDRIKGKAFGILNLSSLLNPANPVKLGLVLFLCGEITVSFTPK
jgi:hypothetical protein